MNLPIAAHVAVRYNPRQHPRRCWPHTYEDTEMAITWSPTIQTGISAIDNERKRLIEVANLFTDADVIAQAEVFSPALLSSLQHIFRDYFDKEEDLMFRIDYPNADKHMLSHSVMLTSLELAVLEHKRTGDTRLIVDFISENYVSHLMSDETSLASYIQNKRNIQAARAQKSKPAVKGLPTMQTSRPTILTSRR